MGIGMLALATLMSEEELLAVPQNVRLLPPVFDMRPKQSHIQPRAKAMISLFQHGGPSHMDLLDPKPELTRLDGKTYDGEIGYSFINRANLRRRNWLQLYQSCQQTLETFALEIPQVRQVRHGDF